MALLIVAVLVLEELQVTKVVRSCVVLSEYVPVAVNCALDPDAMLGLPGVTEMDCKVALLTISVVVPETLPDRAVIVLLPAATEVATPLKPVALLMVAVPVLEELQVTDLVRSCVVLLEYMPVAVNCCVVPSAMLGVAGVTTMDCKVALLTVNCVEPEILPDVAVIVVLPTPTEVAFPRKPIALLTVATAELEELQVTDDVISCVVLFE